MNIRQKALDALERVAHGAMQVVKMPGKIISHQMDEFEGKLKKGDAAAADRNTKIIESVGDTPESFQKKSKPFPAPAVMRVGRRIIK